MTAFDTFLSLNSKRAVATPATVFIYRLNDPVTGKCRYIGKTGSPHERLVDHLGRASRQKKTRRDCWIFSLMARGLQPVLEILDEVPVTEWEFWEREYIRVFRMIGMNLTNLTDGGESPRGLTEESKEKMRAAARNRVVTAETRAKQSENCRKRLAGWNRGRKTPDEVRQKISAANRGKPWTPEFRKKMEVPGTLKAPSFGGLKHSEESKNKIGNANRGKKRSPEMRARISAGHKGLRPWNFGVACSEETRQKISRSHKGVPLSEETKRRMSLAQLRRYGKHT